MFSQYALAGGPEPALGRLLSKWYRVSIRGKSVGALTSPLTSVWYRAELYHYTAGLDGVVPNYI